MISKYQAQLEKSPQKVATKRKTAHRVKILKIYKQRGVRTSRRQADHPLLLSSQILYQEPPSSSNNIHSRPNREEGPVQQPEMVSPLQRFKSIYIVLSLAWKNIASVVAPSTPSLYHQGKEPYEPNITKATSMPKFLGNVRATERITLIHISCFLVWRTAKNWHQSFPMK